MVLEFDAIVLLFAVLLFAIFAFCYVLLFCFFAGSCTGYGKMS